MTLKSKIPFRTPDRGVLPRKNEHRLAAMTNSRIVTTPGPDPNLLKLRVQKSSLSRDSNKRTSKATYKSMLTKYSDIIFAGEHHVIPSRTGIMLGTPTDS